MNKKLLFVLGFCLIMLGILLGAVVNKWLGLGVIICSLALTLIFIWKK